MRKWKTIVSRVLILVVSILAIGAGRFRYSNLNVEDFSVHIKDSLNSHLTDSADIQRQLNNAGFDRILGTRANELDLHRIEMIAKNDPYVNNAQAYFTLNEELVLEISQRTPILRIQNAAGKSFYVDENGLKMPTSRRGTVKVPFASGNIIEKPAQRDSLTTDIAKQLYYIAS
jgi:cell division protein FtsQ